MDVGGSDALVLPTRGEGWGLPIVEVDPRPPARPRFRLAPYFASLISTVPRILSPYLSLCCSIL